MDLLGMAFSDLYSSECFVAPLALITRTLETLLVCTLNVFLSTGDAEESFTANGFVQSWARDAPKHMDHKCMLTCNVLGCVYLVAIELGGHRTGVLYAFMHRSYVASRSFKGIELLLAATIFGIWTRDRWLAVNINVTCCRLFRFKSSIATEFVFQGTRVGDPKMIVIQVLLS
jgi:hypothetical protein